MNILLAISELPEIILCLILKILIDITVYGPSPNCQEIMFRLILNLLITFITGYLCMTDGPCRTAKEKVLVRLWESDLSLLI